MGGVSLWRGFRPPHAPPRLLASEIKQTFLSIHLASLLAFEQRAAEPQLFGAQREAVLSRYLAPQGFPRVEPRAMITRQDGCKERAACGELTLREGFFEGRS